MSKKKKDRVYLVHQKKHDSAAEIAEYYGINPVETPSVSNEVEKKIKGLKETESPCKFSSKVEEMLVLPYTKEKASLVNTFINEWGHLPKPISIFYELPFKESGLKKLPKAACYGIDIIGSSQSISDAILIQTSKSILEDAGYKKLTFEVNCIGNRDAAARFEKELISYFRKNISSLTPDEQKVFKTDVFHLLSCPKKSKTLEELIAEAPQAMTFLSEEGRSHFKQVLEHLEELDIEPEVEAEIEDEPLEIELEVETEIEDEQFEFEPEVETEIEDELLEIEESTTTQEIALLRPVVGTLTPLEQEIQAEVQTAQLRRLPPTLQPVLEQDESSQKTATLTPVRGVLQPAKLRPVKRLRPQNEVEEEEQ